MVNKMVNKMRKKTELTCIGCPLGCQIAVELKDGEITELTGNTCRRGEDYARKEVLEPTRTVTGSVRVRGGSLPVVSVRTKTEIPKEKITACAQALKTVTVQAPVAIGDVILTDVAGTGADLVATKAV